MKRFNLLIVMSLIIFLGLAFSYQEKSEQRKDGKTTTKVEQQKDVYTCPMHPEIRSDKPGKCPKCGMNLQKGEQTETVQQPDDEMSSTCMEMCEMMMKNPSMMKKMHEQMMEEMEESSSDSTHMDMGQRSTMKSCCQMGSKKK